eukprot:365634-Chlamydomonas_euryale.AAC.6
MATLKATDSAYGAVVAEGGNVDNSSIDAGNGLKFLQTSDGDTHEDAVQSPTAIVVVNHSINQSNLNYLSHPI